MIIAYIIHNEKYRKKKKKEYFLLHISLKY